MLLALGQGAFSFDASAQITKESITWSSSVADKGNGLYEVTLTGRIDPKYHTYSITDEFSATEVALEPSTDYTLQGELYEPDKWKEEDGERVFYGTIKIAMKVALAEGVRGTTVKGTVSWRACTDGFCLSPEDWDFAVPVGEASAAATAPSSPSTDIPEHSSAISDPTEDDGTEGKTSLWALILEAILWGFAMLLTPCVFPMVPMTISFFMKGSSNAAQGRFKAFLYGLFIVLLYTLPISIIIFLTWLLGGSAVTADIFNWLATHWIPNIIFFLVFMTFAASFFGAFEITLPSSLVNKSDKKAGAGDIGGIFFMALTLVLVSFSCTGPIVGSVLIKSTQGEFWTPMVTMLAFSVAFALPFTIFAMFPSLLKKMKGGSWMNSVKVVLGFIEVALGFKFLSTADQTYHWGLLDREIYLAIWIVVFSLMGLYLLGKIRFPADPKEEKPLSVGRLALVIATFSFVVYLIPGMWGAPLKALSGYLPPIETQDFVVYNHADGALVGTPSKTTSLSDAGKKYDLTLPHSLQGYFTLEEGFAAAKREGKPLFVDITGHGCVNCREMEQRVWSDPRVLEILRNDYVITALYTDDKTKLDEKDYMTTENGKVLKDLGRVNSYIVRTRFGVNAQPNYVLLSPDGEQLAPIRGYNLDVASFITFLEGGLEKYRQGKN